MDASSLSVPLRVPQMTPGGAHDEHLRSLWDSQLDPFALLEAVRDESGTAIDLRYVEANLAALAYHGVSRDGLIGSTMLHFYPGLRENGPLAAYLATAETGEPVVLDDYSYANEVMGEDRRYDLRAVRFGDGIALTWRDVTDRHRTTVALAASQEHYRLMAENAADLVVHLSNEGEILWISPSVTHSLGWTTEQVMGRNAVDFAHPDEVGDALTSGARARQREASSGRRRLLHSDGTYRWFARTLRPIFDARGVVVSQVGAYHDIQSEVDIEVAAVDSERRYQLVAENASDVVFRANPDAVFEWVSPSVTDLMGWTPHELDGTAAFDLIHPDDRARLGAAHAAVNGGDRAAYTARFRCADGTYRWVDVTARAIVSAEGVVTGRVGSWRDAQAAVESRAALAASQELFRLLAENASDVVLLVDPSDHITWASPSAKEVLGWSADELVGRAGVDVVHPDDGKHVLMLRDRTLAGEAITMDLRLRRADGGFRWMSTTTRRVDYPGGSSTGRVVSLQDIQAQVEARQALEESEHRYRLLAENASDVVLATSVDGTYEWVSESVTSVLGWQPSDLVGHSGLDFIYPDDQPRMVALGSAARPGEGFNSEMRFRCSDGSYRWFASSWRPTVEAPDVISGYVGSMVDISQRKTVEAELAFAAAHDPLTGLANRTLLRELATRSLERAVTQRRASALLMMDLDNFKHVNDSLGHAVGDQVLQAASIRITDVVGSSGIVARHGGDQILVFVPGPVDELEALGLGRRIISAFHEPIALLDTEFFTTVSVGIALAPPSDPPRLADDLLREADAAMHAAKASGRDRLAVFAADMQLTATRRLESERDLRHAMLLGELEVWYQPEIQLTDGSVRAVEALLRWRRPDGSVRPAGEFISLAEDTGMILEIGKRVVQQSVAQAAQWSDRPDLPSVVTRINLSPRQLTEQDLVDTIDEALSNHPLDPQRLCMEITESVLLRDDPVVQSNIHAIHQRGIQLAIDDFGTGYAALTYLHRYPVDVLKIDQSFVRGVGTNRRDRSLVAGVIALATELGLTTTGEGVETVAQEAVLRELGCHGVQGYLYSRAIPGLEIPDFCVARRQLTVPG